MVGTNHRYAPIEVRERLSCQPQILRTRLKSLIADGKGVNNVVVLSTCNRTEIYAVCRDVTAATEYLIRELSNWSGIPAGELRNSLCAINDEEAVRHIFKVSSGLDSLVIGEQQIQGQVREAVRIADQADTSGRILSELFHRAYRIATIIRKETGLGNDGSSVSSAFVSLLGEISSQHELQSLLLVGAGKMITLAASDLSTVVKTEVLVANRTYQRAEDLAKRIGGKPIRFEQLSSAMESVDAVFTCTGSSDYLIKAIGLEAIMKKRSGRPLILIDASVPRNVEPTASMIRGVKLYNIDDLAPYVRVDELLRKQMISAEEMIEREISSFYTRIRLYNANEVLRELRKMAEDIREKELSRTLRKMGRLSEHEKEILDLLTTRIVNKLLYEPTVRLKEHISNGDGETYESLVRELFAIDQGIGRKNLVRVDSRGNNLALTQASQVTVADNSNSEALENCPRSAP
jgi:glutamyl-tRNA reductase